MRPRWRTSAPCQRSARASTVLVLITLSAGEMNGDVITLVCIDQTSPKEWADLVICIPTTA